MFSRSHLWGKKNVKGMKKDITNTLQKNWTNYHYLVDPKNQLAMHQAATLILLDKHAVGSQLHRIKLNVSTFVRCASGIEKKCHTW